MSEDAGYILRLTIVAIVVSFALFLGFRKCANDAENAVPFKIKGDIEYIYDGDSAVHHYEFEDLFDPKSSIQSMDVNYYTKNDYTNKMVLVCTYKYDGYPMKSYEKELFYVPDKQFKVNKITWKFTQTRK